MSENLSPLPITITSDGISVDESFLTITKSRSFLSRHLRRYYLSVSTVYPKIIYKTFWIEERVPGLLAKSGMKLKATYLYSDIVGIEFAKTKTICSVGTSRLLEVVQGNGLIILQHATKSLLDEAIPYVIHIEAGKKAVIPANWDYAIVNTGKEPLVTLELYNGDQQLHKCNCEKKGSGIYVIERNGIPEIVKNSQYKNVGKYATVNSEEYVTALELDPTIPLAEQLPAFTQSRWFACDLYDWHQPLDRSSITSISF